VERGAGSAAGSDGGAPRLHGVVVIFASMTWTTEPPAHGPARAGRHLLRCWPHPIVPPSAREFRNALFIPIGETRATFPPEPTWSQPRARPRRSRLRQHPKGLALRGAGRCARAYQSTEPWRVIRRAATIVTRMGRNPQERGAGFGRAERDRAWPGVRGGGCAKCRRVKKKDPRM